jgi:hypothetical protein
MGDQARAIGEAMLAYVEAAARDLLHNTKAGLIERCPVDTGNARAHFYEGINGSVDADDPAAVAAWKLGEGALSIVNNVPYIDLLIAGSSSQAPAGWDLEAIDRAVQETQEKYDGLTITVSSGLPGLTGTSVSIEPSEG